MPDDRYIHLFSTTQLIKDVHRRSVRGGTAVMAAEIGSSLIRIASMALLARLLVPEDFGLLAMVTALTVFAERFKDLGLGDATVQAKEINHDQVSNLFWINLSICIGIALFFACLAKGIAWFYDEPRLTSVTLVLASTFFFSGLVIQHQALLRRQLRFDILAFIQLASAILSVAVASVLAYRGFGYWSLVIREFVRALLVVIGTWVFCPWRPGLPKPKVGLKQLLFFGRDVTGFNLIYFFSRSLDKILIGKLNGPVWVGLYTNAYQLVALPISQIQHPVKTVALPALGALQANPLQFKAYYEKMLHLLTFFSMPVVAFTAVFADAVVTILLGEKWSKVIPIFQVLALGAYIEPVVNAVGPAMVAAGRTKEYFHLGLLNSLLSLLALLIGSFWGVMGIASSYSISVYISLIVSLLYGLRKTPVRIKPLLGILAANSFCTLVSAFVLVCGRYAAGWNLLPQWLILFVVAGVLVYLGLWLLVPGGKKMLAGYWNYTRLAVPWMK